MKAEISLGVPKLGIITEVYEFNDEGDCEALNLNVANGCHILNMKELVNNEEGKQMEQQITYTDNATQLTPEQIEKFLAIKPEGEVFITEDEEPTEGTVKDSVLN